MARGLKSTKVRSGERDPGGFVALPWSVLDSAAYKALSHPARSLPLDMARQYVRDNNGRMLASFRHLKTRGWTSVDTISRAKQELIAGGFLYETVKGHRPNKASWYAVTWLSLDRLNGYDPGAIEGFERGAYRRNEVLQPSGGVSGRVIAPSGSAGASTVVPWPGAVRPSLSSAPTPSAGNHLEEPSALRQLS
jgi:hypothetical protein